MLLERIDFELLEFVALSEPWSMVCGEFWPRYGGVEVLVARVMSCQHAELLTISADPGAEPASAAVLLADAVQHGLYEDVVVSESPGWMLTATDKGFRAVEERLKAQ